jgi:isocitrate lyase
MIEAGACALQIENQVSDAKQCGHQAGKVTVPHEDFIAKIHALRYAFLEMGLDDGIIVARTDSEGADLTQKIPVVKEPGDIASQYISYLETTEIDIDAQEDEILIKRNGKLHRPKRLASGLYQFRADTQIDRVVLDCVSSFKMVLTFFGSKLRLKIEEIAHMVNRVRETVPNAKLVYNNSPSFNWTLNFRQQAYDRWVAEGKDVSAYDRAKLMSAEYDATELAADADAKIRTFQADAAREAGVFHHLITLPTYHTAALSTHELAQGYFGSEGMLAYVAGVQRKEIRGGIACVKHQAMAGSDIGDDHKEIFSGDNALKAHDDAKNTMNQFAAH